MSPGPVFVALVNPKSGGNVGSTLLARFRDILDGGRVYNLAEEGPKRALEEHWGKPNLRIIGRTQTIIALGQWTSISDHRQCTLVCRYSLDIGKFP